jgi:hypothetical protein
MLSYHDAMPRGCSAYISSGEGLLFGGSPHVKPPGLLDREGGGCKLKYWFKGTHSSHASSDAHQP